MSTYFCKEEGGTENNSIHAIKLKDKRTNLKQKDRENQKSKQRKTH